MKTMATASMPSRLACSISRPDRSDVEQLFHGAVGADALVDLDDALVELLGKDDLLGEDVGPRLIGDAQARRENPW